MNMEAKSNSPAGGCSPTIRARFCAYSSVGVIIEGEGVLKGDDMLLK